MLLGTVARLARLLPILIVVAAATPAAAQNAGDLDPSFGTAGRFTTNLGRSSGGILRELAALPDGRLLMAGQVTTGDVGKLAVVRLMPDGSYDASFGDEGRVVVDAQSAQTATGLALDASGRIVVVGNRAGSGPGIVAMRFMPDGPVDTTFGVAGVVGIDYPNGEQASAVAIQPDGRIVVAGSRLIFDAQMTLARLNEDGSPDSTFSDDGLLTIAFGGAAYSSALNIQADGRILVSGLAGSNFAVARVTAEGVLDPTYSGDGIAFVDFAGGTDRAESADLQSDGSLVLAGSTTSANGIAVARLTPAGVLDPTFSGDGRVVVNEVGNVDGYAVAIAPDGRIGIAGTSLAGAVAVTTNFVLARLTAAGALDPTFDGDGSIVFGTPDVDEFVFDLVMGADASMTIVGSAAGRPTAIRYTAAGQPDGTFGEAGWAHVSGIGVGVDLARATVVDAEGRVLVAGNAFGGLYDMAFVMRLTPDGVRDSTFGDDGVTFISVEDRNATARDMVIDPLGRIVIAGAAFANPNYGFLVARLHEDGTLDGTFAAGGVFVGGPPAEASAVVVQSNGRIVAGTGTGAWLLLALTDRGSPDTVYGPVGVRILDFGFTVEQLHAMVVDPLDRMVVSGTVHNGATTPPTNAFAVARLTVDGQFDPTFSGDGRGVISFGSGYGDAVDVDLMPDGRIVLGGWWQVPAQGTSAAIARLLPEGVLDPTFSGDGRAMAFGLQTVSSMALTGDGRVHLAGTAPWTSHSDFAVIRFTEQGVPDPAFGLQGRAVIDFASRDDVARGMALTTESRVLLVGSAETADGDPDVGVARLLGEEATDAAPSAPAGHVTLVVAPNPAGAMARVAIGLPSAGRVRLTLHDVLGREIAAVVEASLPAGTAERAIDLEGIPAGRYYLRLRAGDSAVTRAFTVLR